MKPIPDPTFSDNKSVWFQSGIWQVEFEPDSPGVFFHSSNNNPRDAVWFQSGGSFKLVVCFGEPEGESDFQHRVHFPENSDLHKLFKTVVSGDAPPEAFLDVLHSLLHEVTQSVKIEILKQIANHVD